MVHKDISLLPLSILRASPYSPNSLRQRLRHSNVPSSLLHSILLYSSLSLSLSPYLTLSIYLYLPISIYLPLFFLHFLLSNSPSILFSLRSSLFSLSSPPLLSFSLFSVPPPQILTQLKSQRDLDAQASSRATEKARREIARKPHDLIIEQHVAALTNDDYRQVAILPKPY